MALRKIIKVEGNAYVATPGGSVFAGVQKATFTAYCKITEISGTKSSGVVSVKCTGDGYELNSQYEVPFSVEDDAPNFIKQAYLHLKTLPEFADATDC